MSLEAIRLSFIAMENSNFDFTIYRKSTVEHIKQDDEYLYRLPFSKNQLDIVDNYIVSFEEKESFVRFECNSMYNISLTKKWLMEQFILKIKDIFDPTQYKVGKYFIPNVSFVLKSFKEGHQTITMEPYYLKSLSQFGFILDYKFNAFPVYRHSTSVKVLSLSQTKTGEKNRNFYSDKLALINGFIDSYIPQIFPLNINDCFLDVIRSLSALDANLLEEKKYIFEKGTSTNQFQGVKELKPLEGINKEPLFVFIFEKSKVNTSRELVKALRGESYPTFSGMKKMFDINFSNENIVSIQTDNFKQESLINIEQQLEAYISAYPNHQIVGVFAGIARDFDMTESYSPYYCIKNLFLKKGLAIQAITIEQSLKKDGFKWSISGIALQLFVKLGGKPWKVKPQSEDCLIFGISSAHLLDENKKIKKYFAYSVCFDSSGIYKQLDILSSSNDKTTYIENLSKQIQTQLTDKLNTNIKKCAIHLPFKLKRTEMECIINSVNSIKNHNQSIEFAFIKVNTDNRFFGYSAFNSRVPVAGTYISLAEKEFLIWFEGLQQGKEHIVTAQNISNPVHIQFIHAQNLSDENVKSYLQDIINLSGANWRGFNAKHTPVSIYYPELIAKFVGKFDQYGLEMDLGIDAIDKVWFV